MHKSQRKNTKSILWVNPLLSLWTALITLTSSLLSPRASLGANNEDKVMIFSAGGPVGLGLSSNTTRVSPDKTDFTVPRSLLRVGCVFSTAGSVVVAALGGAVAMVKGKWGYEALGYFKGACGRVASQSCVQFFEFRNSIFSEEKAKIAKYKFIHDNAIII